MTFPLTLFLIGLAGLVWMFSFKVYEQHSGRRMMLPRSLYEREPRLQAWLIQTILAVSAWLGTAWFWVLEKARAGAVRCYQFSVRAVYRVEDAVNKRYELSKNGTASPHLRKIAEHKTMLRNGGSPSEPRRLHVESER